MKRFGNINRFLVVTALFFSGCTTYSQVAPTIQEMQAVKPYKKKIAVIELSDRGSQMRGVGKIAAAKLESMLYQQFNLVERQRVADIMDERNFINENIDDMMEIGQLLGVDYLIFGNVNAALSQPRQEQSSRADKKGRFEGWIYEKQNAQTTVTLKLVDVRSGAIVFTDSRRSNFDKELSNRYYDDEQRFHEDLRNNRYSRRDGGYGSRMNQGDVALLEQSVAEAVNAFRAPLTQLFPHTGRILEKLSETEVLVNLGSAYGIKPGDQLVVYNGGLFGDDPNTGLSMNRGIANIRLTVTDVTSGVALVAKGSKNDIRYLSVGTKVSTFAGR